MAPATKDKIDVVLAWLANQGPITVILFLILIGGGYTAQKSIPLHLQQIHGGYMEITAEFRAMSDEKDRAHLEAIKAVTEHAEKAMDRMERLVNDKQRKDSNPFAGAMK